MPVALEVHTVSASLFLLQDRVLFFKLQSRHLICIPFSGRGARAVIQALPSGVRGRVSGSAVVALAGELRPGGALSEVTVRPAVINPALQEFRGRDSGGLLSHI